jgi:hypothetical protein
VLILPMPGLLELLVKASAEVRPLGRVPFLDTETGQPSPHPQSVCAFILRGEESE